jgi:gas vesicle protein
MTDGYDRFDNEGGGGSSFVMGLLTGTVLGAGLGMLFAPKAGSELRHQLSDQAGHLANTASEGYRRASEAAGTWKERGREVGREMYDKARDAVSRGVDEADRYVRETTGAPGSSSSPGSSSFGSETVRGASSEQIRGTQPAGRDNQPGIPGTPRRS